MAIRPEEITNIIKEKIEKFLKPPNIFSEILFFLTFSYFYLELSKTFCNFAVQLTTKTIKNYGKEYISCMADRPVVE